MNFSLQGLCFNCFEQGRTGSDICIKCGYDNASNKSRHPMALEAGTVLNEHYIIGRVLGQGGFGITYVGYDTVDQIKIAIKEFLPETMARRNANANTITVYPGESTANFQYGAKCFLDEAYILAELNGYKNIAGVRTYFEENNTAYFTMDYVEGISLKDYVAQRGGKLDAEEVLRILLPIMDALGEVHKKGIIHRDVTPENIYITKENDTRLLDFGAARYSLGDKSKSLDVILKAGYAPKEQYTRHGKQCPYTDVYSLAACFYACISGYVPPESLDRMDEDKLIPLSKLGYSLPYNLENAIMKGLSLRGQDRFATMAEFREAIFYQEPIQEETNEILLTPLAGKKEITFIRRTEPEENKTVSPEDIKKQEEQVPPKDIQKAPSKFATGLQKAWNAICTGIKKFFKNSKALAVKVFQAVKKGSITGFHKFIDLFKKSFAFRVGILTASGVLFVVILLLLIF